MGNETSAMNYKPRCEPPCDHLLHIAFEFPTVDDLMSAHKRLKEMGIEPVLSAYHSVKTLFYYLDPDGGYVELFANNYDNAEQSAGHGSTSPPLSVIHGLIGQANEGSKQITKMNGKEHMP